MDSFGNEIDKELKRQWREVHGADWKETEDELERLKKRFYEIHAHSKEEMPKFEAELKEIRAQAIAAGLRRGALVRKLTDARRDHYKSLGIASQL